jgi:hypothetical protein
MAEIKNKQDVYLVVNVGTFEPLNNEPATRVNNILASTNLNKATTKNVKKHKNRRQNLQ